MCTSRLCGLRIYVMRDGPPLYALSATCAAQINHSLLIESPVQLALSLPPLASLAEKSAEKLHVSRSLLNARDLVHTYLTERLDAQRSLALCLARHAELRRLIVGSWQFIAD